MKKIKKIVINLPYIKQEVYIGRNIKKLICEKIKVVGYDKFMLVIDENVYKAQQEYIDYVIKQLGIKSVIFLWPTPNFKSYSECDKIFKKLVELKASRKSCVLAIGGGYVSDIAGYAASVYMRGIDFVQISTTVMSMADPVVGKVAINYGKTKNLLGSFYSPRLTFCDMGFIKTINITEKIYGLTEIWKHAILMNDKMLFDKIEQYLRKPDDSIFNDLLVSSVGIKKYFVEKDIRDLNGKHKALSLGHTMANFFEKKPHIRHGVAVFYGLIFEILVSDLIGKINKKKNLQLIETAKLFEKRIGMLKIFKKIMKLDDIVHSLSSDKINSGNKFKFVIPTDNGYIIAHDVQSETIRAAIHRFREFNFEKYDK